MPTTVNIQWNAGQNKWQASPSSAGISKSGGIIFNIGNIPAGKTGVRLCYANSNVFGVSFLEYTSAGNNSPAVTGSVNQSSPYHCQDGGTTCVPQTDDTEPFDVTITSNDDLKAEAKSKY